MRTPKPIKIVYSFPAPPTDSHWLAAAKRLFAVLHSPETAPPMPMIAAAPARHTKARSSEYSTRSCPCSCRQNDRSWILTSLFSPKTPRAYRKLLESTEKSLHFPFSVRFLPAAPPKGAGINQPRQRRSDLNRRKVPSLPPNPSGDKLLFWPSSRRPYWRWPTGSSPRSKCLRSMYPR